MKDQDFTSFWKSISAEGDLNAALAEFNVCYLTALFVKGIGMESLEAARFQSVHFYSSKKS